MSLSLLPTLPRAAAALGPADVRAVPSDLGPALLAYLNLPPVGAFADAGGPVAVGTDAAYELPSASRAALGARRPRAGFADLGELCGAPGFGPAELEQTLARLGDLGRHGHRVRPVWGGPAAEAAFFDLLDGAQRYIHISTYIIGGHVGLRMARLLHRKLQEGVKVRVLFTASGFVVSGSPSGTGFVSRLSELRAWWYNDRYLRARIVGYLRQHGVPLVNSAPIGAHWTRRDLRARGIRSAVDYYRWARAQGFPDEWLAEQEQLDRGRGLPFAVLNVDHRKMIIVDGERAMIGSQNIADSYFYGHELHHDPRVNRANWQWHDSSAILEGGAVAELNRLFARRWLLSGGDHFDWEDRYYAPPPKRAGHAIVTLAATIPGQLTLPWRQNLPRLGLSMLGADRRPVTAGSNGIRDRVRQLPELCTHDFYVEHCYPSDGELLDHWSAAAARLPDFTFVAPLHYDTDVLGYECDRFYPAMMQRGARLWGYDRAIMHSKIAVCDGWYVSTGSYNLTLRSARADTELQFFVQDPDYGGRVRDCIRGDLKLSRPIVPRALARARAHASVPVFDALVRYVFL